jgi:hypothetical protein
MKNLKLFPNLNEVFENLTEYHKAFFFPLLTVDLNEIGKGNGKVHFITVNGNGDPDIEIPGTEFGYNYIRFKIIGDKYTFGGNINEIPNITKTLEWYQEAEIIYKQHLDNYLQPRNEFERKYFKKDFIKEQFQFLNQKLNEINKPYIKKLINYWITRDKYTETGKFIQGSAYLGGYSNHEREIYETIGGTYDDEYGLEYLEEVLNELEISFDELNFIGSVTGYNYSELGEDKILLFINKDKTEAFQYFNWS